jgi:transposase-like protein
LEHVVAFFVFAPSIREMIYTTNAVGRDGLASRP